MSERPFLLFIARDAENKVVAKVQATGLPLIEKRMTVTDLVRLSNECTEAALQMLAEENQQNRGSRGMNS